MNHLKLKHKHWRGFRGVFGLNASPMLVFAAALGTWLGGCATVQPHIRTERLAAIEATLNRAIAERKFPGVSFRVERDGVWAATQRGTQTDEANAQPIDARTLFDVASITKVVVTATAIQLLIDEGRLAMQQRLADVLPQCAGGHDGSIRATITLAHLLTHTSGLPSGIPSQPAWTGAPEGVRRACESMPTDTPGTAFRYSDVNFILLGAIVEHASGESLDAFAARRIFAPLGMTRTGYLPLRHFAPKDIAPTLRATEATRAAAHRDLAPGTKLQGIVHDPTARFMGGVAGHAGLFSTTEDLARFARMLLDGGRVDGKRFLSEAAIARLTSIQSPPVVKEKRSAGWDIDSAYSRPRGELFSPASFGHTGFTGCILWIDPATKSFYVLLSNRVFPDEKSVIVPMYAEIGTLAARAVGVGAEE